MKVKFRQTETGKEHLVIAEAGDFYILEHHPMSWSSQCHVAVLKSAVDVVPEEKYYKGQRFLVGPKRTECLLAFTVGGYQLISTEYGNRWNEYVVKTDGPGITKQQLQDLAGKNTSIILSRC